VEVVSSSVSFGRKNQLSNKSGIVPGALQ